MQERYDVAIVGTGPAGLSAAVTLKIRNRNILLLGDEELSPKIRKAHEINNYLGLPKISGEELCKKYQNHINSIDIRVKQEEIKTIYSMGKYFSLVGKSAKTYEATALILATGVNFDKKIKGEEEFLGRGVSYCATCDAMLYKGKKVVIIGATPKEEMEAEYMSEVASEVIYIPLYNDKVCINSNIKIIKEKPLAIEGNLKAERLILENGSIQADGFFVLRETVSPGQLVPGLKVIDNCVEVNRKMETNIKGCYACGDVTGYPYQYIKAAGEGNVAALSADEYVRKLQS